MKPKYDYEKRRFIETYSVSVSTGRSASGQPQLNSRDIVNKASELWDEIEHQYPRGNDNERD